MFQINTFLKYIRMSVCISIVPENLGDYFLFLFVPLETTKMSYLSTTRFTCEHCLPQIVIPGFFLVENRFFSHTIHSEQFPFPLLLLEPYFPSLPDLLSVVSSSEKKARVPRAKQNKTRYQKTRQNPHIQAGQGSSTGEKRVP